MDKMRIVAFDVAGEEQETKGGRYPMRLYAV
jgi:hypothetical protein